MKTNEDSTAAISELKRLLDRMRQRAQQGPLQVHTSEMRTKSGYVVDHHEDGRILDHLIICARNGTLNKVSSEYLTEEILCYMHNLGLHDGHDGPDDFMEYDMVIEVAALHGNLGQIPKAVLGQCASACIAQKYSEDDKPKTILHIAAKTGQLNRFPKSVLTTENLFEKFDTDGRNVAMLAAKSGFFEQIPPALVTRTTLTAQNNRGETVFHYLARWGGVCDLPADLQKSYFFQLNDIGGRTPLHWAWGREGNPASLPTFFNEDWDYGDGSHATYARLLSIKDRLDRSVLDYAVERQDLLNLIPEDVRRICGVDKLKDGRTFREVLEKLSLWPEEKPECETFPEDTAANDRGEHSNDIPF